MLKKDYSKTKNVCKVTFTLPLSAAQEGGEVRVLGDFNGWDWENGLPMKASKAEFSATIELATGVNYAFRYLIDNDRWENDWAADAYVPSPFDGINNSLVSVSAIVDGELTGKAEGGKKVKATGEKAKAEKAAKVPAKAKSNENDDLKKIEGIGPKIAELLNAAGISTFAELAKAKLATLQGVLDAAGSRYKMHDPGTWAKQAKLAADGNWEKLAAWQEELKGGKK